VNPENFKILYVWQAQYPWDVRVEKICGGLSRNGFEVEILARRGPDEPISAFTPEPEKIPIHRVGPKAPRALSLPVPFNPLWERAIAERIRIFKPTLLIARDIPLALPSAKACARAGIPMVIDMAEHYPVAMRTWKKYQANFFSRFLINTLRLPDQIERASVNRSQGIATVCEEQKERLVKEYGFDPSRIIPILNTPEKLKVPRPRENPSPRKTAIFGYHGVVIQDRGLLTVIRGFDLAAEKNFEFRLVISGGGESFEDVQHEVARAKYRDRISLTGPFKPSETAKLYSEVDFGIVSWKVNEFTDNTIANKFFDYAAFGKPILYTRTKPMERLMKTMRCGVGFENENPNSVADGMLKLLDANYQELSKNGQASVHLEFNWEEDTQKLIRFLHETIKRSGANQR
jgi:glycosyltransferase involved in cell wall biosynthesis